MNTCTICEDEKATDRTGNIVHCNSASCDNGAELLYEVCGDVAAGENSAGIFWIGEDSFWIYSNGSFEAQA